MPNTSSAKKASRQEKRRNVVNKIRASKVKTAIRKMKSLLDQGKHQESVEMFSAFQSSVHGAVTKKVFSKNKAARIISRCNVKIKEMSTKGS